MTRTFLTIGLLFWHAQVWCSPAGPQPNVVIIFIDDMGYGDIGPFGATAQRTPSLDRMAREGMKFTSFYAAPVCSVSRAQLMTGCYGARVSVPGVYFPAGPNGLHPSEFTIAERLKEHGYTTACVGKWHLGDQPEFLPTRQGFDRYFGIPYSNDMQRKPVGGGERVVPLLRNEKVAELLTDQDQRRLVERYTQEALNFIRENKDKPFFLYLPHTAIHTPIHPGESFAGKSANGRLGDWIEEVDWSVGKVLDTLRELKLQERTLVIFTSDNGPWLVKGADGGSAGPLRGGKGSTWEGGVRVPMLAWWPGRISPGTACDAVAGTIDILPTAVALAGGRLPSTPVIDGRDLSPLLFGLSRTSQREAHYYFLNYRLQAVRQGPWKLALVPQTESMGQGTSSDGTGKLPRLYNLEDEIGEKTDLAGKHPEIVRNLQALAARLNAEIGGASPTARRPAGEVLAAKPLYPMEEPARAVNRQNTAVQNAGPARLDLLKVGDTLAASAAPQIAKQPFKLECRVETTARDAVILAHGGLAAGYALHLKGGRVAFAVRTGRDNDITEIITPTAVESPMTIEASLGSDSNLVLKVNALETVTGRAPRLIPQQPAERFCLGHDDGQPVTKYSSADPLRGHVAGLKITTP